MQGLNLQYMDDNHPTPLDPICLADGSLKQNGKLFIVTDDNKLL